MKDWDLFQSRFGSAFRLMLRDQEGSGGKEAGGTCTLFSDGAVRFLVTARHVVGSPLRTFITVPGGSSIRWPRSYSQLEPAFTGVPEADIAWARAVAKAEDTTLAGGLPIDLARIRLPKFEGRAYVAVGFPGSKAKVRVGTGDVRAKMMFAAVEIAPSDVAEELALDHRVHLAFTYARKARVDLMGGNRDGADPHGMSGGAIIALLKGASPNAGAKLIPVVVGILTEFHAKHDVLVAVKIEHWLHAAGFAESTDGPLYRRADA